MAKTKRKPDLASGGVIIGIIIYLLILVGYSMSLVKAISQLIWLE